MSWDVGNVSLLVHVLGPLEPFLGALPVGEGQGDLAPDGLDVLLEDALAVLGDRDLGDLAGEPGVLEIRPDRLGR